MHSARMSACVVTTMGSAFAVLCLLLLRGLLFRFLFMLLLDKHVLVFELFVVARLSLSLWRCPMLCQLQSQLCMLCCVVWLLRLLLAQFVLVGWRLAFGAFLSL